MIEYIPDLREVERVPGLDIPCRPSADPIPGFKDQFGNFVAVGDWVTMGANQGRCAGGLRLAQVTEIKPKATQVFGEYEPIPESEWRLWHRQDFERTGRVPERVKYKPGPDTVTVEVRFYFDPNPTSKSRRHGVYPEQIARYYGVVPYAQGQGG